MGSNLSKGRDFSLHHFLQTDSNPNSLLFTGVFASKSEALGHEAE